MDATERFSEASRDDGDVVVPALAGCGGCRLPACVVGPAVYVRVARARLCRACLAAFAAARRTVGASRLLPADWVRPQTEAGGRVPPLPPQP